MVTFSTEEVLTFRTQLGEEITEGKYPAIFYTSDDYLQFENGSELDRQMTVNVSRS